VSWGGGGTLYSISQVYIYEDEPLSVPTAPPPPVLTSICEPFKGGREEDEAEGLVCSDSSGGFWTGGMDEEEERKWGGSCIRGI
jgi:hypothetical protein